MADQRPWYDEAFDAGYLELYPHRDQAAARGEVAGLLARGLLPGGGRVLDLGCGFGRHLAALVEARADAWGLDRSRALLARVPPGLRGRVVRGDFRALPFRAGAFAAVAMLFSSFGYFEDEENERVLAEVIERRRLEGARVIKEVEARAADGSLRRWREDVRLYEPAELAPLLARAGLELRRVEGDFDGRAHGPETPRQILWGARSG